MFWNEVGICHVINTTQSDDFINPIQFMEFKEFREFTLSRRRPLYIETSPLIWGTNQWTGFYMITASVMKELKSTCLNTAWKVSKYRVFPGPYSVRMRENTDQKNSVFGRFSRSESPSKQRLYQGDISTKNEFCLEFHWHVPFRE